MSIDAIKKKTIFITIFHSFVSKNILNTAAVQQLRDSGKYRIVLLVPEIKKDFFQEHYRHEDIIVEGVSIQLIVVRSVMHIASQLLINTHYLHYKRKEAFDADQSFFRWVNYGAREFIVMIFANKMFSRIIFRYTDYFLSKKNFFSSLFEKYQPELIFSTDIFEQAGIQLVREAQGRGIKTVGMVRSWDNCLSKGLLRAVPETVMVNNSVLAKELQDLHGVHKDAVEVVGLPQFDSFVTQAPKSREEVFSKLGFDPNKKLVLFAPAGSILSDADGDICDILLNACEKGSFKEDVQFFVRNHPHHPADLSKFENVPGFYVQYPGSVLDASSKETELTPDDQDFLRNILAHTDVLLWVATSLCLDALVYDVPEIVLNFDGYKQKEYYNSVRRYHDEGHMKKMLALNPFKIANNPEELIEYVNTYLEDRAIDSDAREKVRNQQLFCVDGKSGSRVASVIENLLT